MAAVRDGCRDSGLLERIAQADHPPSGFFGFVLGLVAAGVGLARALGKK